MLQAKVRLKNKKNQPIEKIQPADNFVKFVLLFYFE